MQAYPAIPTEATEFQSNYGYEVPVAVHDWQWSVTFGRWSALVTFKDGWHGWTYPKSWVETMTPEELAAWWSQ
jgi:hypothetical protein